MTEILNLDEMSNVVKQFKFKNKTHDICEISLGDFIAMTSEQKVMEKKLAAGGVTEDDLIAIYRKNILRVIPTMNEETLDLMTVRQLKKLLDFINTTNIDEQVVEEHAKK